MAQQPAFLLFLLLIGNPIFAQNQKLEPVKIGTKAFTESVILGEILKQSIESDGHQTVLYKQLGGTQILWNAFVDGEIDISTDYSGTIIEEILSGRNIESRSELISALGEFGIQMFEPLGFNNTYALGMKREVADELGIETISDLKKHPKLIFGFSSEFIDREDG